MTDEFKEKTNVNINNNFDYIKEKERVESFINDNNDSSSSLFDRTDTTDFAECYEDQHANQDDNENE